MKQISILMASLLVIITVNCKEDKDDSGTELAILALASGNRGGTTTYTLGGTVTGLGTDKTLVLTNDGVDKSITANGEYTFDAPVNSGSTYNVTVKTQPSGQTCTVSNGTGTVNANVSNINVSCCSLMGGASNCALTPTGVVTTLAGGATSGNTDGTGTAALFDAPWGITTDGTNIFVADTGNNRIRKIVIATGVVTTLAGNTSGNSDGTGTAALFASPQDITSDGTNLYVADRNNHRIRKIVIATGVVTTLAGNAGGSTDGTGTAALFNNPGGITTDGTNLYVADTSNHRIRKIVIATGVVTTLAGNTSGNSDGTGTAALFNNPRGITTDGTNLFVGDTSNHRIRKIVIATGVVTTLAGNTSGNSDGTGTAALFNNPNRITTDGTNLYVADTNNNRIRKIVIATGVVTTLAGNTSGFADGTGIAALFGETWGITTDGTNLYVADADNHRIRKIE